jgi:hypothetical protein
MVNARHLHGSPDHGTPIAIVEAARRVLGTIDLDPMTSEAAQARIRAARYFTIDDDGFSHPWTGRVVLNPAGGTVKRAWHKLMAHYEAGDVPAFVWVGYSLEQLQTLQRDLNPRERFMGRTPLDFSLCIPHVRLAFEDAAGVPQRQPTHANYIAYGGPNPHAFVKVFETFGAIIV